MNKKILFLLITIFLFSLTSVFAITWRHDGTDTMRLDDAGNLFVLSNVTADWFLGYLNASYVQNAPWLTYYTEADPFFSANLTAHNATWSSTFNQTYQDAWKYATNSTFALISEPLWSANFTAYNSSWSSTYNSSYVPYTGSNANVVLGDYNFSVGTSDLFVNANTGYVGIGTTTPSVALEVGSNTVGQNAKILATLGSELVPNFASGNWTATNGWSADTTVLTKVTNASVGTITPSAASWVVAKTTYKVVITASAVSSPTAITYTLGGVKGTGITATTITDYITAATTGKLIISGAVASTATITAVSVKALTNATGDLTVEGRLKLGSPMQAPLTIMHDTDTSKTLFSTVYQGTPNFEIKLTYDDGSNFHQLQSNFENHFFGSWGYSDWPAIKVGVVPRANTAQGLVIRGYSASQTGDLFGVGTYGYITNNLFVINATGKVGIGTAAPTGTLSINSSNALGSLRVYNTTGSEHLFVNGTTGNVGIGTTTPQNTLNVVGDGNFTGIVYRNNKALIDWSEATNGTVRLGTNQTFYGDVNINSAGNLNITAGNSTIFLGRIKLGIDSQNCAGLVSGEICRNSTATYIKG